MPEAGGPYAYVLKTFGPLAGFLILWGYVVLIAGPIWSFQSYTAALYIVKPVFPDCQRAEVDMGVKILAAWIIGKSKVKLNYTTKIVVNRK
jgi:amino acid transporter